MNTHIRWLIVIVLLAAFCLWVVIPKDEDLVLDLNDDDAPEFVLRAQQPLGLDLIGGLRVLLEADIPTSEFSQEDLVETANNVSRRVNALGLSEATIQV